ncbi:HNH endonuclease [Pseudomonas sp. B392_1p]|uniref:HNH endonuclease n=1 Tax=Pseudomonas sp. B392_1p TaxID=3457507 RepID=UPI003FD692F7
MSDFKPVVFTVPGEPQGKGRVQIEMLQEFLAYDPGTGLLTWKKRRGQRGRVGQVAGAKTAHGYIGVGIAGVRAVPAHRIAFALMTGSWPELEVDHIDGDRSNNAWANLRLVTTAQNHQNMRKPRTDNAAGHLGVSFQDGRYRAQIQAGGKKRWLGQFATPEEASAAYVAAKRNLHEFGTL